MKKIPIQYGDLYYEINICDGKEYLVPCKELENTQKYIYNFLKSLYDEKENNYSEKKDFYTIKYDFSEINELFSVKFIKRMLKQIFIKTKFPTSVDINGFYKFVTLDDKLPEKVITTPLIINIIIDNFEEKIDEYCKNKNIIYVRTNSQLVFSSKDDISEEIKHFLKKTFT